MLRSKNSVFLCLAAIAFSGGYGLSGVVWADDGAIHQAAQAWPIALGASGGNILDRSSLFCCSGTLGALVEDATGRQYILSNNHVLARFNQAVPGEDVNHPGQIDQACGQDGVIADFSSFVPIQTRQGRNFPLNFVDAAIAEVRSGAVATDGALLDIGVNSGKTVPASLNQAVQKSGRTTGHTTGKVIALDVTVDVGYSEECGSNATKTARFTDQIRIGSSSFSAGGDSGSLILEHGAADPETGLPRAVGLLFAGNSTSTIANPIDLVLSSLGVSLVSGAGTPAVPPPTGSIIGVVTDAATGGAIAGASVSTDTGESTTTNSSGGYALSDVPAGSRSVTANASGFTPDTQSVSVVENATATANFALNAATTPTQSEVQCITYTTTGGKSNDRHMAIAVLIVDDFGMPVPNANVSVSVTQDGAAFGTASGTTDGTGHVTFTAKNSPNGVYETTVTSVVASGLTFDASSTPANSFAKGSDPSPTQFCQAGGSSETSQLNSPSEMARASRVKERHGQRLFDIPGVIGHGVGQNAAGKPVIEIYLENENAQSRAQVPDNLEGIPVRIVVTGPFTAF